MKTVNQIIEDVLLDLDRGDTILYGKFKNKSAEVNSIKTDDKGLPVAVTNKGDVPILKIRIPKLSK